MEELKACRELVAGATAGVLGTLLGYPLDTIKVTMQMNNTDMMTSTRKVYSDGGIARFYRGVASPLLALTILNTLNFSTYGYIFSKYVGTLNINDQKWLDWRVAIAGAGVGPLSSIISTPFEMVKTQMQLNSKNGKDGGVKFRSSLHAATHIIKNMGFSTLYRAHGINTMREIVFLGTYFFTYEHFKYYISSGDSSFFKSLHSGVAIPLAGGCAGAVGWFVSFPLDCIKAQMQGIPIHQTPNSSFGILKDLLRTRGVLGLYAGVLPSIIRAFLVSSSRFSAYEGTLYLIDTI